MLQIDNVGKSGKRAYRRLWIGILISLVWGAGIAGCSPSAQTPTATQEDLTATPSQAVATTSLPTARLAPQTPRPTVSRTSAPATSTPNPSPTPLELAQNQALPFVRDGTPLPENLAVISPENLTQLTELGRWGKGEILTMAYAPDGSQVAAVTSQGVYFYSTDNYELKRFVPIEGIEEPVAISGSLRYLAVEASKGTVMVWDLETGQLCRSLKDGDNYIQAVAFTPDESQVYASDIRFPEFGDTKKPMCGM